MSDDIAKFEFQRMQLASSLNTVAEALRNAAGLAENFAHMIQNSKFTPGSFVTHGASEEAGKGRKRKAAAIEDGDDKAAKRKPKLKDPNAPKRPASSFILFQNEVRKDLKEKNPNITYHDLMGIISRMWAELSEDQKAIYTNAVASAKEQYSQDKAAYDARSPEEVAAANAAIVAKKAKPRPRALKAAVTVPEVAPPVTVQTSPSSESSSTSEDADSSDEEDGTPKSKKKAEEIEDESSEDDDEDEKLPPPTPASKKTKEKVLVPSSIKKKRGIRG